MPLFNNWPWLDLSKLNLDYILSKIKVVEDAELDAQQVLTAAAQILPKVDQVNSDADRAEAAAAAAQASATLASEKCDLAENAATECAGYESSSAASASAAAASAGSASADKAVAEQAVDACQEYADAADHSRILAEAAADRAESASSTTGYRAYTGVLAGSTVETLTFPDGTYQLNWFANDSNNSSAIYLLFKSGESLTYRNIQYNGDGDTGLLIGSTATAITLRNQLNVDVYWFITGCEAA